jgi:chromosome segregation ATPase
MKNAYDQMAGIGQIAAMGVATALASQADRRADEKNANDIQWYKQRLQEVRAELKVMTERAELAEMGEASANRVVTKVGDERNALRAKLAETTEQLTDILDALKRASADKAGLIVLANELIVSLHKSLEPGELTQVPWAEFAQKSIERQKVVLASGGDIPDPQMLILGNQQEIDRRLGKAKG